MTILLQNTKTLCNVKCYLLGYLEVEHSGSGNVNVPHSGLLVECVNLFELIVGHGLIDLVADVIDGLFKITHGEKEVCQREEIQVSGIRSCS